MKLRIIQNRKYYYLASGILFLVAVFALIAWGLKPGLDFTGGSLLEVNFSANRPDVVAVGDALKPLDLGDVKVQSAGEQEMMLRFKTVDQATHQKILDTLSAKFEAKPGDGTVKELRYESVGPTIGKELTNKAWMAILIASLAIVLYIAYAFRKVSRPVVSWKYGISAIVALIHDITIVAGLFAILGHFAGIEVDALFITALLTILGFSVHDTIVVFDRTRENLSKHYTADFEEVVNDSVNQTMSRSINTSVATLLVLIALFFFGGESIRYFVLALIVGISVGTYSSIFVASPIVVDWHKFDQKRKLSTK
ncbi:MAG: protein translocase subunit SecF [Patescibacteria group bacterium]|jgi:preprotein translocase subunit SecF